MSWEERIVGKLHRGPEHLKTCKVPNPAVISLLLFSPKKVPLFAVVPLGLWESQIPRSQPLSRDQGQDEDAESWRPALPLVPAVAEIHLCFATCLPDG